MKMKRKESNTCIRAVIQPSKLIRGVSQSNILHCIFLVISTINKDDIINHCNNQKDTKT